MSGSVVGVFDSGVGGLSVLREIRRELPGQELLYFADQHHVPYGVRPPEEVRRFSESIAAYLIGKGAGAVVVACNTASAAALRYLRDRFPQIAFVGMEPAVKPAAAGSRKGAIGVIATMGTFQGEPFAGVVDRFAHGVRVLTETCPGLVEAIERGAVGGAEVRKLLQGSLDPLLREGIDALVLGCTHYPFALEAIREVVGPELRVIDPAPAVARQVRRVLEACGGAADGRRRRGSTRYITSGDPQGLARAVALLLGEEGALVAHASWQQDGRLSGEG